MDEASKLGEQAAPARRTYGAVAKAALGVAGVGAVAALRGSDVGASVSSALFGSPTAALDDAPGGGSELSFYVWSDYTDTYGDVGTSYTWYSDGGYAGIVEPYVPQTLVADCAACSPDTTYTWTFSGGETAFGNEVERMFYALETYDVQVSATAGDSVLASYAGTVVCRYVRREIRQLSSTDRNRFFDAMKVLWTQTSDIGQDIYGPSFLYKKLLGFTNEGWPDDYSTVSECFGHNATDLIPFSFSLIDTDTDDDDGAVSAMANMSANATLPAPSPAVMMDELNSTRYTNQELYDKMGPDSMAMPYVYQDFDWDHCSHAGFDFTGIDTSAEVTDDVLDMTPTDVDEAAAPPSLDDDADDARRKLTGASMTREEIVAFRWQLYKMTVPEYIQDLF